MKKVQRGSERREIATDLIENRGVSINQACRVANIDRKTYRYQPKKKQDNKVIENLLKTYSAQHPTYGFQKLFNLIRLKNYSFNHKRVYRIYCDLRLNLKIKPKTIIVFLLQLSKWRKLNLRLVWLIEASCTKNKNHVSTAEKY